MLHKMKLNETPFRMMTEGTKTIELRLNDEKRRKVMSGDFIEFTNISQPEEKVTVRVTELYHYDSFSELLSALPKEVFGFSPDENVADDYMDSFYSREQQKKYGALGIGFRITQLQKFVDAQENGYKQGSTYSEALSEIRNGEKVSHWMWYVFPQISGPGYDQITDLFSIRSLEEAADYIAHPVLGDRLREITNVLLELDECDPMVIFGYPDAYKLMSCMTLFKYADPGNNLFQRVLDKYCQGNEDSDTTEALGLTTI